MKKSIKYFFNIFKLAIIFIAVTGCEGYKCGDGLVIDKLTNQPLDSVLCVVKSGTQTYLTDSTGKFNLCNKFGGCMPCKEIIIELSKQDYKTIQIVNPVNLTVYLEK